MLVDQGLFGEVAGTPGDVIEAVAELQEEHGPMGYVAIDAVALPLLSLGELRCR